ncbi:MAG: hypothetical protein JSU86_16500 [Phycisphaerales bacterium]|nr:MAG: hypothetical protein JSU86_16500 [Phycisphaerales bacterium]
MVRAVRLVAFAVIGSINVQAQEYAITEIATLGGDANNAVGINDLGQVVGISRTDTGLIRGYLWQQNDIREVSAPPGARHTWAMNINNAGQICGGAEPYDALDSEQAIVWHDDTFIILDTFPYGGDAFAWDINANGEVAGYATTMTGIQRAALWTNEEIRDFGIPYPQAGCQEEAVALNSSVQAVANRYGSIFCSGAYLWDGDRVIYLSVLQVNGINDKGTVVGEEVLGAFMLQDEALDNIGALPGDAWAGAWAVNENNTIVGWSYSSLWGVRAFLWDGVMIDLNDQIPEDSGWLLQEAYDINVHGQIVGYGLNPDGESRGYLLSLLFSQPGVSMFVGCLSGPYPDSPAECELFDFNDSGTIDLEDFAYFQSRYRD